MGKVAGTHVEIRQPACDVTHGCDDSGGVGPSWTRDVGPSEIGHRGFALVAVMLLIAVVGIVTAVVLQTTSTEIKISGNHRRATQEFYAAEAGLAEARSRLRKSTGAEDVFIGSTGIWQDPLWMAYIVTSSAWATSDDPDYSTQRSNVFPVSGNPRNTIVQSNSVQTDLEYWLKIRHKNEYDAERAGHRPGTPHYLDQDGRTSRHNKTNRGNVVYFGYPSRTSLRPVSFTTTQRTPWLPIEKIIAHGTGQSGGVVLEAEVVHPPGPNQVAALYASGNVSLTGGTGGLDGHDTCGAVDSLPPVLAGGTVTSGPSIQFHGTPATPQPNAVALNLDDALANLNTDAVALTENQHNQSLGSADVPMVFLADGASFPAGLRMQHVTGSGILLVEGNATLEGEVRWDGMILVTGTLFLNGHGSGIMIRGAVWAGEINQQTGPLTVRYDSCRLQAALLAVPTQVQTWKEIF